MREVVFHGSVLDEIDDFIARHRPERGGILLGPIGLPVVSEFLPDPEAATTGSTYSPSPQVGARVVDATRNTIEVKGIVHSHPGGLDVPSSGDHNSFANWLRRMPFLPSLITPIVTVGAHRGIGDHKIALEHGELSVFLAEKRAGDQIALLRATPRVLDLTQVGYEVGNALNAVPDTAPPVYVPIDGHHYASTTLTDSSGSRITVLTPYTYPTQSPVILVPARQHGLLVRSNNTTALTLPWDLNTDSATRLAQSLRAAVGGDEAVQEAADRHIVARTMVGKPSEEIRDGLRARLEGSVALSVKDAKILVVGLGSGGSQTLEALVRSSVENVVVIDPDDVEAANLSRSVYDAEDIGTSKCQAITRRMQAINPSVTVVAHENTLADFPPDALAELVASVDYVVAATDDPEAQYRLNKVAWSQGRPAVFAGVYERGAAGEIVYTIPGVTSCFHCATAGRRGGRRGTAELNYGTGTLVAEPALGPDIAHVVTMSVKVLLGMIELSDPAAHQNSAASMVATAAGAGRNYLQTAMVADYDYFPKIFEGVRGQHAYQTVWLETRRAADCSTCGEAPQPDALDIAVDIGALRPVSDEPRASAGGSQ